VRFACWSGPTYRGVGRDLCSNFRSPEWLNWAFRMGGLLYIRYKPSRGGRMGSHSVQYATGESTRALEHWRHSDMKHLFRTPTCPSGAPRSLVLTVPAEWGGVYTNLGMNIAGSCSRRLLLCYAIVNTIIMI